MHMLPLDPELKPSETAILFGAGISLDAPSLTPLGFHLTQCLLDSSLHHSCFEYRDIFTTSSEVQYEMGQYLRFEKICETLENHGGDLEFLRFFEGYREPNANHQVLARLAQQGVTLLTTNFDCLVEAAARSRGFELEAVNLTESEPKHVTSNALYKLHGSIGQNSGSPLVAPFAATIRSVSGAHLVARIKKFLTTILKSKHLIVMGYSGYDDFDVSPALVSIKSSKKIFWINHDSTLDGTHVRIEFRNTNKKPRPKSILLCEKMIARGARNLENVAFLNCHTGQLLFTLAGEEPSQLVSTDIVPVNFREHIRTWAEHRLDELRRAAISVDLLIVLGDFFRAHSILKSLRSIRSVCADSPSVAKHLLSKYFYCLTRLPFARTETDTSCAIELLTANEWDQKDIDLLTNLGGFLLAITKHDLASKCFRRASELTHLHEDSEQKIRVELNVAVALSPQTFTDRSLLEDLLARAERCSAPHLTPSLLWHLADNLHPDYYLRAADAAALVGDRDCFVRTIVYAFNVTDKYRSLVLALYSDSDYVDLLHEQDLRTFTLFCALVARYLSDENSPDAADIAMRGWQALDELPDVSSDIKANYALELLDILAKGNMTERALLFLDKEITFVDSLVDPWAKFGILSRKYSLAPSPHASAAARSYALGEISLHQESKNPGSITAALDFLIDTNNSQTCVELATTFIRQSLNSDELMMFTHVAGEALFNLGRMAEAKEVWLSPYRRYPDLATNDSSLLFNLARIELQLGTATAAARLFLYSEELGGKTMVSARHRFRAVLQELLPERQLTELAGEAALILRNSTGLEQHVRDMLVAIGLIGRS